MPNIVLYLKSGISIKIALWLCVYLCIFTITLNMITFEEKALNNFQICWLSNVKNDNIPTAILICYYPDVDAIFFNADHSDLRV